MRPAYRAICLRLLLLPILLAACPTAWGKHYAWDNTVDSLYNMAISLKLGTLKKDINIRGYDNFNYYLLDDYLEFLEVFVYDDSNVFERFEGFQEMRFEALKKGETKSPWHLYIQAEMHLHHALASLKMKEYYGGFMSCRRAWKLYQSNKERFPKFAPNLKGIATLQAVLGIIPSQYQWGVSLFGMEGDLKRGMETLRQLSNTPFEFRTETTLIYVSLLIHLEGKYDEAWQVILQKGYPLSGNLFTYYTAANAAIYGKQNDAALHILKTRPTGSNYVAFAQMEYLHGLAYLNKLDTTCRAHFNKFLAQTRNQGLVKSAWQKLGWSYLLEGDMAQYRQCQQRVLAAGTTDADADKQAQKEAEYGQIPDIVLLKARLLFDGGYFEEALEVIAGKTAASYPTKAQQLELVYRKGRIYDALGRQAEAIAHYKETIKLGENEPLYFAANAALNLALIYEKQGNKPLARQYFNLCLNLKDHEYYTGLSQKAKAGLERVR